MTYGLQMHRYIASAMQVQITPRPGLALQSTISETLDCTSGIGSGYAKAGAPRVARPTVLRRRYPLRGASHHSTERRLTIMALASSNSRRSCSSSSTAWGPASWSSGSTSAINWAKWAGIAKRDSGTCEPAAALTRPLNCSARQRRPDLRRGPRQAGRRSRRRGGCRMLRRAVAESSRSAGSGHSRCGR